MITELIATPIFELLYYAFNSLDVLSLELPSSFLGALSMMLNASSYFLPLGDLLIMSGVWFTIATFNIWWTFATWTWKMLPFT